MSVTINGTNGLTFADSSTQNTAAKTGMVNLIINGACMIDQRNAGASVTVTGAGQYPVDRFLCAKDTSAATVTAQQSTTAPAGFTNSLLWTTATGASPAAGDENLIWHKIEGFNVADFGWGTANAQPVTLSIQVRSSLTGTFGLTFRNSANNRSYVASFTINSANTFETKSITIAGDTSGTWLTNNGTGLFITFDMGAGTSKSGAAGSWSSNAYVGLTGGVKMVANTGATFYITGVQLEKGSTATSFDYRPYGTELALCQRYYQKSFPVGTAPAQNVGGTGAVYCNAQAANAPASCQVVFPVQMRTTPSNFTTYNPSAANGSWRNITASSDINSALYSTSPTGAFISSNTQVMNQYAIAAIHYTAESEL